MYSTNNGSASASGPSNTNGRTSATGSGPSRFSTPSSADYSGASSSALPQRKRPFPHLDDDDASSSRNKSLRTTPSPSQAYTGATTPLDSYFDDNYMDDELIDLTGDDEDVAATIAKQRAIFQRYEQQKEDERLAKSYMDNGTPPNLPSPSIGASASAATGPNAFDRILGRPSQPSQSSQSGAPPLASAASQGNNYGGPSNQNQFPMPGSFNANGLGDLDFLGYAPSTSSLPSSYLPSNLNSGVNAFPNFSNPAFPADPTQPQFGQPSFPQYPPNGSIVPPAEQARRAALNRQEPWAGAAGSSPFANLSGTAMPGFSSTSALLPGSNQTFPFFGQGSSSLDPMASRPGMLNSGAYDPLQNYGGPSNNGMPGASGSALSSIIDQTNNIDWTRGLDALGQPLDDRLRSYYEDLQDDPRKTEEEIKELLANIRPDEEIPVEDRIGTPESLRYPLYPHQQLALKWMMTCEEKKNKGGILADDMGLGKTISTLSLIMSNQSLDRNKTTLIIAPVALVRQWEIEIAKKVKAVNRLSVFMLHGKNSTYDEMKNYDVVLTTYGKLSFEEKRFAKVSRLQLPFSSCQICSS